MAKQHNDIIDTNPSSGYRPPDARLIQDTLLWRDKRRPFLGLPLSFTTYSLYTDRLMIQKGFLTRRTEEIRLYRILDVSLTQTLLQRIFKLGSVKLCSADMTAGKQFIHDVRHPVAVHRLVSDVAEQQRIINRVGVVEYFDGP